MGFGSVLRASVRKIFCGIIIAFINFLSFSGSSPEQEEENLGAAVAAGLVVLGDSPPAFHGFLLCDSRRVQLA